MIKIFFTFLNTKYYPGHCGTFFLFSNNFKIFVKCILLMGFQYNNILQFGHGEFLKHDQLHYVLHTVPCCSLLLVATVLQKSNQVNHPNDCHGNTCYKSIKVGLYVCRYSATVHSPKEKLPHA